MNYAAPATQAGGLLAAGVIGEVIGGVWTALAVVAVSTAIFTTYKLIRRPSRAKP